MRELPLSLHHGDALGFRPTTSLPQTGTASPSDPRRRSHLLACGVFLAVVLAMFADVLLAGGDSLLSVGEDMWIFYYWRQFGFSELAKGNLALWNPHVFSGAPYFAGFQPALLYPPNWLHLVLPVAPAINAIIALHVFLAGMFVYAWTSHRGLHPAACILVGLVFMFSGAYFLQIYRGHLSNLSTMVWAPLILLAVDGCLDTGSWRWSLVGMAAVAMQLFAGHVQYVFYTAVVVGAYAFVGWIRADNRPRAAAALAAIYAGGASLAAIQLLPGLQATAESLRTSLSYEVARSFAFPPENLLTLALPSFFGAVTGAPYLGRWTLTETSVFVGTVSFLLALYGAIGGAKQLTRGSLGMVGFVFVLAFGDNTPLFRLLFDYVPGFGSFRGITKFTFLATLFCLMLTGIGADLLLRAPRRPTWPARTAVLLGAVFVVAGGAIWTSAASGADGWWGQVLASVDVNDFAYTAYGHNPRIDAFFKATGGTAAQSLLLAGGNLLLIGGLLLVGRSSRMPLYVIGLLGVLEVFAYAYHVRPTFNPQQLEQRANALRTPLAPAEGTPRIMSHQPYVALGAGALDIWGGDPMVLARYAEFIALTQGEHDPSALLGGGRPSKTDSPLLGMLRLQYAALTYPPTGLSRLSLDPLPRALLVPNWHVVKDKQERLATMAAPDFDPRTVVLLEEDPGLPPGEPTDIASVSVTDLSTDAMMVEAEVPAPSILLLTENYSTGWRATAADGAGTYRVMPGNHTLRAIPLPPGKHRLKLEYVPRAFTVGKWISILSLLAFCATWGLTRHTASATLVGTSESRS